MGSIPHRVFATAAVIALSTLMSSQVGRGGVLARTGLSCNGSWSIQSSVDPGIEDDLGGVVAISATDVWAVGDTTIQGVGESLAEHWDGLSWSVVPSPSPGHVNNQLLGAAASSSTDVWAIGDQDNGSGGPLAEHWNGTAWTAFPAPASGTQSYLLGVTVLSPTDTWAVGEYLDTVWKTLTEHWDGSTWSIMPSPNGGDIGDFLMGVTGASSNDVWAVGTTVLPGDFSSPLIEHWDGNAWTIVPSPTQGTEDLFAASAVSSRFVWGVGNSIKAGTQPFTERWNGTSWKVVKSPTLSGASTLYSVSAVSKSVAWAAGYTTSNQDVWRTLVLNWNGTGWQVQSSPNQGSHNNYFAAVSAVSSTQAWAVGHWVTGRGHLRTLIEEVC